ncbi:MAG: T9SS type A sorting domain-containing protein [Ignavibacteriae bacterium]|nr:T9SS type A sorting domain-containing protein [Ignavibacteriota bacterium]
MESFVMPDNNAVNRPAFQVRILVLLLILFPIYETPLLAQRYRTFSQEELSQKKINKPSIQLSSADFTNFHSDTMDGIHIEFGSQIREIRDSGGFPNVSLSRRSKILDASGKLLLPGMKIRFTYTHITKDRFVPGIGYFHTGTVANARFMKNDQIFKTGGWGEGSYGYVLTGGNIRDFLYRRALQYSGGMILGIKTNTIDVGWIRYTRSDRRFFSHTGSAQCFDFKWELKNPRVAKHNNHLLGELHALKLAIIGNDSAFTDPWHDKTYGIFYAPLFGDLIYNDTANANDPGNEKTIREIAHLADSALTYCSQFAPSFYAQLDSTISRINRAFDGEILSRILGQYLIAATHDVNEFYFLQLPPGSVTRPLPEDRYSAFENIAEDFYLEQNYPNPFNPSTVIEFNVSQPSLITLTVYNMLGQKISTLLDYEEMEEGLHLVNFDATDLPSGVYYYRLVAKTIDDEEHQFHSVKRMLLLK